MQWRAEPAAGFTTGTAWLPPVDPGTRNVAGQTGDAESLLELYRALIRLRRTLAGGIEILAADPAGLLVYRRGETTVALNLGEAEHRVEPAGDVTVATAPGVDPGRLGPGQGVVTRGPG
jgi:alpha-glucosidase